MAPLLTILTPTYNGMPFLIDALKSTEDAVATGLVEHVVSDGGSSDGSLEVLASSHALWRSEPDTGQSDALNRALAMATGEWVGWLNCDEFYLEHVLEAVVTEISQDRVDLIYGDYVEVDTKGRALRLVTQHDLDPSVLDHFGLALPSCTAFFRRSFVDDLGGFDVASKTMMDWDLWLHIARAGARSWYTGRAHAGFTRHAEQASTRYAELVVRENAVLNRRYRIHSSRSTRGQAKARRVAAKLQNGGYLREARFRRSLSRAGGAVPLSPSVITPVGTDLLQPFVFGARHDPGTGRR